MTGKVFISDFLSELKKPLNAEILRGDDWEIRVEKDVPGVTILDDCDSVLIMAHELVPFVLTLLRVIFENKWYGEAQDRTKL